MDASHACRDLHAATKPGQGQAAALASGGWQHKANSFIAMPPMCFTLWHDVA